MTETLETEHTGVPLAYKKRFPPAADRRLALYALVALLLAIPCFWQPHIQADDLSSHLYNAWLVNEVGRGHLQGLYVVPQYTNVLFDRALSFLLKRTGSVVTTERVAVVIAVQIFFWGCFAMVTAGARRRAWNVAPFLAVLAYGAVFRMGFFNFYISVGICAWAIALAWHGRPRRLLLALPLLAIAYTAHLIPCLWAIGVIGYVMAARRLRPSRRPWLAAGSLVAVAALARLIAVYGDAQWQPFLTFTSFPGIDQVLTFGAKYLVVAGGLFGLWILLLIRRAQMPAFVRDLSFHLWALGAVGCVLMPMSIWLPLYSGGLTYITIRLSFFSAILLCAVLARVRFNAIENIVSLMLLGLFVSFTLADERALNQVEQEVAKVLAALPQGTRVVATLKDSRVYVPALEHVVDRECIGRCFDFGNYEPATTQFRLRATLGNTYVMTDVDEVLRLEHSEYVWNRPDIELIRLIPCEDGRSVCTVRAKPGEALVKQQISSVPKWFTRDSPAKAEPADRSR